MDDAVALVPAFNEAGRIAATVRALGSIPRVREVIVVDDVSTDATAAEAATAGARCLSLTRNAGKGDALNAGVILIRGRVAAGVIPIPHMLLIADGDLGDSAAALATLLSAVAAGADVAIADLPPQPGAAGFGLARGLGRRGLARLGGRTFAEPLSGQRAIAWRALPAVLPFAPRFGVEVAMTLAALDAGLAVVECPCDVSHRPTPKGLRGIAHRARQGAAVATELGRFFAKARRSRAGPLTIRTGSGRGGI